MATNKKPREIGYDYSIDNTRSYASQRINELIGLNTILKSYEREIQDIVNQYDSAVMMLENAMNRDLDVHIKCEKLS